MKQKYKDLLYSIIFLALSVAGIIYADVSIDQRVVQYELARPDRYVQIWLGLLLILSILYLIRTLKRNDQTISPKIFYSSIGITIGLFFLFLIVMPYVGYTISSFGFIFILTFYYNVKSFEEKLSVEQYRSFFIKAFLYALVLSIGSGLLFKKVLNVRLPEIFY